MNGLFLMLHCCKPGLVSASAESTLIIIIIIIVVVVVVVFVVVFVGGGGGSGSILLSVYGHTETRTPLCGRLITSLITY